jgi:ferrochelatase
VAAALPDDWDWRICYQSRVGPLRWIGPSTVEEIERAGAEGLGVVVDPIAFVSEHVETLVELDRDYAEVARRAGAQPYVRVPALGTHPLFIEALARRVEAALAGAPGEASCGCAEGFSRCGFTPAQAA